jgi:hypothetical protein
LPVQTYNNLAKRRDLSEKENKSEESRRLKLWWWQGVLIPDICSFVILTSTCIGARRDGRPADGRSELGVVFLRSCLIGTEVPDKGFSSFFVRLLHSDFSAFAHISVPVEGKGILTLLVSWAPDSCGNDRWPDRSETSCLSSSCYVWKLVFCISWLCFIRSSFLSFQRERVSPRLGLHLRHKHFDFTACLWKALCRSMMSRDFVL